LLKDPAVRRATFSLLFWAFLVVSTIAMFPIALAVWLVTAPFDRRLVVQHRLTSLWASLYSWTNPAWQIRITGRERIRSGIAYVMVANHQSFLDILLLFRVFAHFKWVSKAEMFRIPLIGWNMALNRYVKLRRGNPASIAAMMRACEDHLANGSSVMIFPEGTRSADGRLKAFKHGAFTLAKAARAPILPIVIEGTANALPKHGFVLRGRHAIRIRIQEPIAPESFAELDVEALTERVHELFARELGEPTAGVERRVAAASPR
jgi:1-acyl-sn-glycerol-3-phosphate acyltransferase